MIALICVDIMNDLVAPNGKLAADTQDFLATNRTLQRIARIQEHFREQGHLVIHTKTAFKDDYAEYPNNKSPIFTPALKKAGALERGTWGTEIPEEVAPHAKEPVIVKHRIGTFDRTRLEMILRTKNISNVYFVGGFTSRSIAAAAFGAHDADFNVTILSDGCFDINEDNHQLGQKICAKVGEVKTFDQIAMRLTNS